MINLFFVFSCFTKNKILNKKTIWLRTNNVVIFERPRLRAIKMNIIITYFYVNSHYPPAALASLRILNASS